MDWTTACPDWEERIVAGQSLITSPPLFPEEAEAALDVFKSLRVVDVPGCPTFGEIGDEWLFDIVAAVFGAQNPDGIRLIREFFICVSKKNGKSTVAAGIMLTALIRNWRMANELLMLAPTIEAANNAFTPAAEMVRIDPELHSAERGFLLIQDHLKTITHLKTRAALKVVAADKKTVVGKKAGFILVDETWELGKSARADAMLREATGGMVSRPEGFLIHITTQSDEPPAGVFKDKLAYARKVRDGEVEDRKFLPIIYEFPADMVKSEAYLDPDNFYVTNPNLGRSVSKEWLEDELRKEKEKGAETRNVFLAKHLNVEISTNMRTDRWAGADFWAERGTALTLDALISRCEVAAIGIDGGGLDDLFGLTVVGRDRETKHWLSWSHAWCHKGVLKRRKQIATLLEGFERDNELTIVGDELADLAAIVAIVQRVKDGGILASVAVDPAGLGGLVDALAEIGVTQEAKNLVGVSQGFGLMNAIKTAERKLVNGTFFHAGGDLMNWCVGNLRIEPTATAIRATKQNAGDAKIDPAMAMFNAVAVMSLNPQAARSSPYETRGIRMV